MFAKSRVIGVNIILENKFNIFFFLFTIQNTPIQQKSLILNSLYWEKQFPVLANPVYTSTTINKTF